MGDSDGTSYTGGGSEKTPSDMFAHVLYIRTSWSPDGRTRFVVPVVDITDAAQLGARLLQVQLVKEYTITWEKVTEPMPKHDLEMRDAMVDALKWREQEREKTLAVKPLVG